jgi:lysozyme family protein
MQCRSARRLRVGAQTGFCWVLLGLQGTCGGSLHAGPRLHNGLTGTATGYGMAHGRAYSEGVNVQWALGDATAAEGGCFVCALQ